MMKLYVLFGQRDKQSAPEALAVIDEFTHDESDVWIHEQYHEEYAKGVFEALRIVEIDFDQDELDMIFNPSPIQGDAINPMSDLVQTCQIITQNISNREECGSEISPHEEAIRCRLAGALSRIPDLTN